MRARTVSMGWRDVTASIMGSNGPPACTTRAPRDRSMRADSQCPASSAALRGEGRGWSRDSRWASEARLSTAVMQALWPPTQATVRGVKPLEQAARALAPACSNNSATARWPCAQARYLRREHAGHVSCACVCARSCVSLSLLPYNGVRCLRSLTSAAAPAFTMTRTQLEKPRSAAKCSGVVPVRRCAKLASAPADSSARVVASSFRWTAR